MYKDATNAPRDTARPTSRLRPLMMGCRYLKTYRNIGVWNRCGKDKKWQLLNKTMLAREEENFCQLNLTWCRVLPITKAKRTSVTFWLQNLNSFGNVCSRGISEQKRSVKVYVYFHSFRIHEWECKNSWMVAWIVIIQGFLGYKWGWFLAFSTWKQLERRKTGEWFFWLDNITGWTNPLAGQNRWLGKTFVEVRSHNHLNTTSARHLKRQRETEAYRLHEIATYVENICVVCLCMSKFRKPHALQSTSYTCICWIQYLFALPLQSSARLQFPFQQPVPI